MQCVPSSLRQLHRTRWRRRSRGRHGGDAPNERMDGDVKRERERQVSDRSRWRGERDSSEVKERSTVEERERETYVVRMSDLLRGHVGQHPFHTFHFVLPCRTHKRSVSILHPPTIPSIIHSSPQPMIPRPTSFVVIVNNGDAATARVSERERERRTSAPSRSQKKENERHTRYHSSSSYHLRSANDIWQFVKNKKKTRGERRTLPSYPAPFAPRSATNLFTTEGRHFPSSQFSSSQISSYNCA